MGEGGEKFGVVFFFFLTILLQMLSDCLLFRDDFLDLVELYMPLCLCEVSLFYLRIWLVRYRNWYLTRVVERSRSFRLLIVRGNLRCIRWRHRWPVDWKQRRVCGLYWTY